MEKNRFFSAFPRTRSTLEGGLFGCDAPIAGEFGWPVANSRFVGRSGGGRQGCFVKQQRVGLKQFDRKAADLRGCGLAVFCGPTRPTMNQFPDTPYESHRNSPGTRFHSASAAQQVVSVGSPKRSSENRKSAEIPPQRIESPYGTAPVGRHVHSEGNA